MYFLRRSGSISYSTFEVLCISRICLAICLSFSTLGLSSSAKLQLKNEVDASDAHRAIKLQKSCLEKIGMDPVSGKIDIDQFEGRTPTSDRDRMNKVMEQIGALEEEFEKVPIKILKQSLAENYDMSEEKVDSILKQLKSKGLIYEPRNGLVNRLDNK